MYMFQQVSHFYISCLLIQDQDQEMFYLTTHSTHFIYGYMEGRKEMFYLWLYGVGHMVKDHSDSKRKPAAATCATLF